MTTADRTSDRHPAQWLALVIGAVYTLVGVVGFVVTGYDELLMAGVDRYEARARIAPDVARVLDGWRTPGP